MGCVVTVEPVQNPYLIELLYTEQRGPIPLVDLAHRSFDPDPFRLPSAAQLFALLASWWRNLDQAPDDRFKHSIRSKKNLKSPPAPF